MNELRITDTNSVNDSKGRAFGLDGNDFLYVIGGIVGVLGCFLLMHVLFGVGAVTTVLLSSPIFLVPTAWVLLLRHNKPAGYAEDLFDHIVNHEGWTFAPRLQPARRSTGKETHAIRRT
jgi:hypothetical protein